MLKREKKKLKKDRDKKKISETVIRKNTSENSDKRKNISEKNNEKTKCFLRGERLAVAKARPRTLLDREIDRQLIYKCLSITWSTWILTYVSKLRNIEHTTTI